MTYNELLDGRESHGDYFDVAPVPSVWKIAASKAKYPIVITKQQNIIQWSTIPGLILSLLLSVLLTYAAITDWCTTGILYRATVNARASVQIVVHLISWILSTAQTFTLHKLIKARFDSHLTTSPTTIDQVKFLLSVTGSGYDGTLPWHLSFQSLSILAVLSVPSLLWAGALTPVYVAGNGNSFLIPVPRYSPDSAAFWGATGGNSWQYGGGGPGEINTDGGVFGDQPLTYEPGLFLTQGATASGRNTSIPRHPKVDSSGYIYIGRSYGIGAAVGLRTPNSVDSFQYLETGYLADVLCIKNTSAEFDLALYQDNSEEPYLPSIYQAEGFLPNDYGATAYQDLTAISWYGNSSIFSLIGSTSSERYIWQIIPGINYNIFYNVQCEVFFNPTQFLVTVDNQQKSIIVSPKADNETAPTDIEATGNLKFRAFQQPWVLATLGNQITSIMGSAFVQNIQNIAAQQGQNTNLTLIQDGPLKDNLTTSGTAEAFQSIIDNSLLTFALTQVMLANDTTEVFVVPIVPAVRLGQNEYVYAVLALSLVTTAIFMLESCLTQCWRKQPAFDISDFKCVLVAASAGGDMIAQLANNRVGLVDHGDMRPGPGGIRTRLRQTGQEFALVPLLDADKLDPPTARCSSPSDNAQHFFDIPEELEYRGFTADDEGIPLHAVVRG